MSNARQFKLRRWCWLVAATTLLASLALAETLTVFACQSPTGGC